MSDHQKSGLSAQHSSKLTRSRTRFEASSVGFRLAQTVAKRFDLLNYLDADTTTRPEAEQLDPQQEMLLAALRFIVEQAATFGIKRDNQHHWQEDIRQLRASDDIHPLSRLAKLSADSTVNNRIVELVLLASLPELHETYATLFRLLHPQNLPYPTVTLVLHWLEVEGDLAAGDMEETPDSQLFAIRDSVEELLVHSTLARLGLIRLEGEGPWHHRMLRPGPGVWEALNARSPRLSDATLVPGFKTVPGLEKWLKQSEVVQAIAVLTRGEPCLIAILGASETMRATRIRALLGASGMAAVHVRLERGQALASRISSTIDGYCVAFMHSAYPWLDIVADDNLDSTRLHTEDLRWELPVLVSTAAEHLLPELDLPVITLRIEALTADSRRTMWRSLLPQLAQHADVLATRYPLDPDEARNIATDLALRQRVENRLLTFDDIGDCLRSRTLWRSRPGVQRVIPAVDWHCLLLPKPSLNQLQQAVLRVHRQITVLDDWGFEQGRNERRGLRMLFYGPPGTGKTLAAEAMAKALGIDLLVVDIASLVSKWIGETEKNLAGVFELAESSRALLLFDEADALFGRRTEANDSNDRHANLETAFLLQRLERYEGVAVLTTNLRTSLDAAFTRRFEYIVEFPEPDAHTRQLLWQLHVPAIAPVGREVNLAELAEWYALSGAQIRNASLGAAFLAVADGGQIKQTHFLQAIEREYDKAGKAHPGNPPPGVNIFCPRENSGNDENQPRSANSDARTRPEPDSYGYRHDQ
jgi:hypothetical protein